MRHRQSEESAVVPHPSLHTKGMIPASGVGCSLQFATARLLTSHIIPLQNSSKLAKEKIAHLHWRMAVHICAWFLPALRSSSEVPTRHHVKGWPCKAHFAVGSPDATELSLSLSPSRRFSIGNELNRIFRRILLIWCMVFLHFIAAVCHCPCEKCRTHMFHIWGWCRYSHWMSPQLAMEALQQARAPAKGQLRMWSAELLEAPLGRRKW